MMVQPVRPVSGFWYNDNSGELATLLAAHDIDVGEFSCCLSESHVGWHPENVAEGKSLVGFARRLQTAGRSLGSHRMMVGIITTGNLQSSNKPHSTGRRKQSVQSASKRIRCGVVRLTS